MIGNRVHFAYIPTGGSLPESYPDADTIYFLEEAKEIRVGNQSLGNVDDLAIHPEQLAETLEAWTIKSIDFQGSGNYVSDITYDSSNKRITVVRSTLPVLSKGAEPTPTAVTLDPGDSFTVITDTSVSGHTITDSRTIFTLPNYQAGPGISIASDTISLQESLYNYVNTYMTGLPSTRVVRPSPIPSGEVGPFEIGQSITLNKLLHDETHVDNIQGNLTLYANTGTQGSYVVIKSDVVPSASTQDIVFDSPITVTRSTPGNYIFKLSGVDKAGNTFESTQSFEFYSPVFVCITNTSTVTPEQVYQYSTRSQTYETELAIEGGNFYCHFVRPYNSLIDDFYVRDTFSNLLVPLERVQNREDIPYSYQITLDINSISSRYMVFRTSEKLQPGIYRFEYSTVYNTPQL